ncbi:phosphate/phosphite/phosphonate ABC transporter substrate-binding protein, partial [bacterium]
IPNQAPDKLKAKYEPFKKYLAEKLGMEVELFVANNYAGVVEAMASGKLDMAYFGGLTYVQAKKKANLHPIVTEVDSETGTTKYYSLIIIPADSPVKKLADLKGKTFAFGDVSSTSGSLYPRIMLDQAGLKVPDDFADVIYTGKHDATALAVQNGKVDAGGLEGRILNKLIADGKVDQTKIRVLAKSEFIEGYPWVVPDSMDKDLENKIVDAFLTMDDRELLKLMKAERFARVTGEDYKYIEEQAARLGLLK